MWEVGQDLIYFGSSKTLNIFKYLLKALQNSAFTEEGWRKCVQTPSFTFCVANDSHVASMLSTLMNNELHSLSCNWTNFTQISKISSQAWFPSVLIVADLGWISDTHSATLWLYLNSRTGEKLIGWDKISNQFNLLMIKIDLDGGKQTKNKQTKATHHHQASTQHFFSCSTSFLHSRLLHLLASMWPQASSPSLITELSAGLFLSHFFLNPLYCLGFLPFPNPFSFKCPQGGCWAQPSSVVGPLEQAGTGCVHHVPF